MKVSRKQIIEEVRMMNKQVQSDKHDITIMSDHVFYLEFLGSGEICAELSWVGGDGLRTADEAADFAARLALAARLVKEFNAKYEGYEVVDEEEEEQV